MMKIKRVVTNTDLSSGITLIKYSRLDGVRRLMAIVVGLYAGGISWGAAGPGVQLIRKQATIATQGREATPLFLVSSALLARSKEAASPPAEALWVTTASIAVAVTTVIGTSLGISLGASLA